MSKIVQAKPTSPGRRFVIKIVNPELSKEGPFKALCVDKKGIHLGGRNNQGRLTCRRRGGGHAHKYRIIDFKRDKDNVPGKVETLEYDPNRSAYIALILYKDGERRYIIAPKEVRVGSEIISGTDVPIKPGNCMPLSSVPVGSVIHCIEMRPGKGAQLARTAGAAVQLIAREDGYAIVRLRSGEIRRVLATCRASIGEVSNSEHNLRSLGKAGASRWRGTRPTVRGVAMNPVDHPHGGGEGRTSGGRHPVSPRGIPTKGYKTRKNKRTLNMIVRDRRSK